MFDEARGKISIGPQGTVIDLRIGVSRYDQIFALAFVIVIVLNSVAFEASGGPTAVEFPLVGLAIFGALVALIRWIGRNDRVALLGMVERAIDAREEAGPV